MKEKCNLNGGWGERKNENLLKADIPELCEKNERISFYLLFQIKDVLGNEVLMHFLEPKMNDFGTT